VQIARNPAQVLENTACDEHHNDALRAQLSYCRTNVRVKNIISRNCAVKVEGKH
jgi:hypothetical protein